MPYTPDTQQDIFEALVGQVAGRTGVNGTGGLTHFEEGTVNHALLYHGYGDYLDDFELALLAMQLSGWIDTAGGPIDEEDLIQLNIAPETVDIPRLNELMDDADLDALAAQNGVTRDPGDRATGEVLFLTVNEEVTVEAGTEVATEVDRFSDNRRVYQTTEAVTPDAGTTGAVAPVEAVGIGPEYNVGPGAITTMPSSPGGVRDVTNQTAITGGELPETNAELRERAKAAPVQGSGGGTVEGITGGLVERIDGLDEDDVFVEEHYNPPGDQANYVEVTVDGGEDRLVEQAIDDLHSTGIRHILNRPTLYYVEITATLEGSPINIDRVESEITRYISERGIGEDINRAMLSTAMVNADDDISNITELEIRTDQTGIVEGDLTIDPDEKAVAGEINVGT